MRATLAALLVVPLLACGDAGDRGAGGSGADTAAPASAAGDSIEVWFTGGDEEVTPVRRPAEGAPLDAALRALVRGPTAGERSRGLASWFGDSTAGVLRRVRAESSHVEVDFHEDLMRLAPGASSSSGSRQLLLQLDSTVLQFPWVETVEYRMEGSCARFWEWLQCECTLVRR